MSYSTSVAANTQLPPSPELRAIGTEADDVLHPARLRSIAHFKSFKPQVLSCSPPVASSYSDAEPHGAYYSSRKSRSSNAPAVDAPSSAVSLGAVAGSRGVTLFRVTRPETPLLVFTLSDPSAVPVTSTKPRQEGVSSLAFQQFLPGQPGQTTNAQLYLAAAHGSSALVWDVAKQSTGPLCRRLRAHGEAVSAAALGTDGGIQSLVWKPDSELLAATTASAACLWDLREPNAWKPTLRFGVARQTRTPASPNVQVACSDTHECAIMDASGRLRVFDIRMANQGRSHSGAIYSVSAFQHAGIGVSYFPTDLRSSPTWMTWGLDSAASKDAYVRIWTSTEATSELVQNVEQYWYMDSSLDPARPVDHSASRNRLLGCQLLGQCSVRSLACARLCLTVMKDSFVTVKFEDSDSREGWSADLWRLRKSADGSRDKDALQNVVSFNSGGESQGLGAVGANMGVLCAAELAVATQMKSLTPSDNNSHCLELLLCCLTDGGFITTHSMPEVIKETRVNDDSLRYSHLNDNDNNSPVRIFPDKNDAPPNDVARIWAQKMETRPDRADMGGLADQEQPGTAAESMGTALPFDMDVPAAYSMIDVTSVPLGEVAESLPVESVIGIENEQADDIVREAARVMSRIEKDSIPCPRLCGAAFGPGVGGLALFNNGDVRKMWRWWDQDGQNRLADVPTITKEHVMSTLEPEGDSQLLHLTASSTSAFPRTLQDLFDMVSAAKEAQWGDQDESDTSSMDAFRGLGGKFFDEDGSEGSSDSADDDSVEFSETAQRDMYDNYFSEAQRPLVAKSSDPLENSSNDMLGPSSEILSSHVSVSRVYDKAALSSQSQDLAMGWKLGLNFLETSYDEEEYDDVDTQVSEIEDTESISLKYQLTLPRYRFLVPLVDAQSSEQLGRAASDSLIPGMKPAVHDQMVSRAGISPEDELERGVHGGEYSVRPNMQESMVFLKKLFSQQHKEDGSSVSRSAMFSPPDSPMLPNGLTRNILGRTESKKTVSLPDIRVPSRRAKLGGITTVRATHPDPRSRLSRAFAEIAEICRHNASVSESLGESGKRDTWTLLAKAVETRGSVAGDPGRSGDALGAGLVSHLLCYYESRRDIQMLATIVCVLRHPALEHRPAFQMLPLGANEHKYNVYIEKYANLLYAWGLLTIRAELNKHLTVAPPPALDGSDNDENRAPALALTCPRCGRQVAAATGGGGGSSGSNHCAGCRDAAFRCALCDTAVRGLFTACDACGHGGHLRHMTAWFSLHGECATGCGCRCVLRGVAGGCDELDRAVEFDELA